MKGYFAPPTSALQFYPVAPCQRVSRERDYKHRTRLVAHIPETLTGRIRLTRKKVVARSLAPQVCQGEALNWQHLLFLELWAGKCSASPKPLVAFWIRKEKSA